jgi:hypothetical protein
MKTWLGAAKHLVDRFWEPESDESSEESSSHEMSSESDEPTVWSVGQQLEAKWKDDEYYYGEVAKVYANGNYSFRFDDGDFARSIEPHKIRERTPIVPFGQADVAGGSDDESNASEEDDESDDESSASSDEIEVDGQFQSRKYNLDALTEFLMQEMKNYEYFLNGTTTSYGESFHSICNLYYPKGSTVAFSTYVMKKCFAGLHWQELRRNGTFSLNLSIVLAQF